MKDFLLKTTFVLLALTLSIPGVFGQNGRYGSTPEDSIRCIRNLQLYGDQHRLGNFEAAMPYWRVVFNEFPRASQNIYIHGVTILSHMINNAETEEEKKAYIDTAMIMFDQRIEYFGDAANVLSRKGMFYLSNNNNLAEAGPGYEALRKSIEVSETSPAANTVMTYMNITMGKFQAGLIDSEDVIEVYAFLMEVLDGANEASSNGDFTEIRNTVESMFAESSAADCDALISIFGDQVYQSPGDVELLRKVNELLSNTGCTESELFLDITQKLHDAEPSVRSALQLSAMYRSRNDLESVIEYIKEAIDLQENPTERATYYLELAIMANQNDNDYLLSRRYANQAIQEDPSLGRAHLHIGGLYASATNCFDGEESANFKNRTVYWVAVDRFNMAKAADPTLSAEANRLIETYSAYFPDMETIFFHEYTEGQTYTVGCWINERTTVRAR